MLTTAINTLIFDLDNTLIDRNAAMRLAVQDWLIEQEYDSAQLQTALNDIMQHDNWGYTERSAFCTWLLKKYGKENVQDMAPQSFLALLLQKIVQYIQPDPQVLAALGSLSTQFQFVLATNGGSKIQRAKVERAKLESFFPPEAIFISGEMGCEKPDPVFFEKIIQKLQLDPGSALVTGDNLINDIQAAAACGLLTCWVSSGRKNETAIQPHQVITNITEISKWSNQLT